VSDGLWEKRKSRTISIGSTLVWMTEDVSRTSQDRNQNDERL
jgi:hypothetical protein